MKTIYTDGSHVKETPSNSLHFTNFYGYGWYESLKSFGFKAIRSSHNHWPEYQAVKLALEANDEDLVLVTDQEKWEGKATDVMSVSIKDCYDLGKLKIDIADLCKGRVVTMRYQKARGQNVPIGTKQADRLSKYSRMRMVYENLESYSGSQEDFSFVNFEACVAALGEHDALDKGLDLLSYQILDYKIEWSDKYFRNFIRHSYAIPKLVEHY